MSTPRRFHARGADSLSRARQSIYKTYIDVVHVAKNDTAKTFTTTGGDAVGDAQRAPTSIFDSGDLSREDIDAKEAAMVVRRGTMRVCWE